VWRTGGVLLACLLVVAGAPSLAAGGGDGPPLPLGTALIRVENGTTVTLWERTTTTDMRTFPVATLTGPGATFDTLASEHYTITSDGAYLTIHCYRPTYGVGTSTGNNIAGARLDGVPGFPAGIWASVIVSYVVGYGGIEASRFAALGSDLATITFMGDQDSELVLAFTVETPDYPIRVDTVPGGLTVSIDGVDASAPVTLWCGVGTTHAISAPSPQGPGDTRHVFESWSDDGAQSHDVLCAAANFTAYFTIQYRVVVATQPAGLGVVVDGTTYNDTYRGWWNASESRTLDAPSPQYSGPDVRWVWQSWSDGGAQSHPVTVGAPATFIAPFLTEVRVAVTTSPAEMRVIVDGTDLEAPQTFWWTVGSSHTLSAPDLQERAGATYRMKSWSDEGDREHEVIVTRPGVYTAVFHEVLPPVSMNWKPFVAAAFSVVLLLVGLYRAWKRPFPFREPLRRSMKTFLLLTLPFASVEAATGVLSLVFGVLAVPPLLGWGTGVDVAILGVGLVAALAPRRTSAGLAVAPPPG